MIDDPMIGFLNAVNITTGTGGIGNEFTTDEDYVRALRHGVDPDGKPLFMPAVLATSHLSDEDLGAIIAHLETVPPVENVMLGKNFKPMAKIMFAVGVLPQLPVEVVSHDIHVTAPERGVSVEYGNYLIYTNGCQDCHGNDLAGTEYPDPAITLITPNITPGGELGSWSEEDFLNMMRTGITPSSRPISELMPWKTYGLLTDDELKAMYLYLQSLPELEQYAN